MANQVRIEDAGHLHRLDGSLAARGWATEPLLCYDRSRIKAPALRMKEWDYYLVNDDEYAVALTLGDLGYFGLVSASLIDFGRASYTTTTVVTPFPLGRFHLPSSSREGTSSFENGRVAFSFVVTGGSRHLTARFSHFDGDDDLSFEAVLDEEPRDSMVIATPWAEDPKAFYYNQKIVAMRARGSFRKGRMVHGFSPDDSWGLLDWGRGVWTRDNTWFWGVAQGWQDGAGNTTPGSHRFGLNLGYGFGDTTAASENIAFVDGVAHKLGRVDFGIPAIDGARDARNLVDRYRLLEPWRIVDDEERLDLVFRPLLDRCDFMDYRVVRSDQHQIFGTFSGNVRLDDGTLFRIGGLRGSAEVVHNVY